MPLSAAPPDARTGVEQTAGSSAEAVASWPLRDYVSPGLRVVRPDACFPRMRAGDALHHPWKYLRRDVPHIWYADERFPLMGFMNRDEATLLHNIALQFAGRRALEIGSLLGWSTCHLALAGVTVDVIDPAHDDPSFRSLVEESLACCGVADRVRLAGGRSPESIEELGGDWSLFLIDGDHEAPAPVLDTLASLRYAAEDCAFVFHDLASPAVAAGLRLLSDRGFHVVVYQTAQIMGMAWRGDVTPVAHIPDPEVAWQVPSHLIGLPISGLDFKPPAAWKYPQFGEIVTSGLGGYEVARLRNPENTESGAYVRDREIASGALQPGIEEPRNLVTSQPPSSASDPSRPSVCIVTSELIGPFKNGGIGTSMTGLAETLAEQGLRVTVLYTGNLWSPDVGLGAWRKQYTALGIELAALTINDMKPLAGPVTDRGFGVTWLVYRFLATHHFDVIHINDCCGEGSLALAAKKLGLAFHDSLLVVALHGPSRWVLELNQTLPTHLLFAAYDFAEQVSIACADVLWSPSRYVLDWVTARGFELPAQVFIQQYAMPSQRLRVVSAAGPGASSRRGATEAPKVRGDAVAPGNASRQPRDVPPYGRSAEPREIVFFGRLEERKGLRLFCNALHHLRHALAQRGIAVTFLGKAERCAGMPSLDYIARRAAAWQFPVRTITDLGQPEALQYLFDGDKGDKLAVMPSPFDNSPCTVYEALQWRIPFLAARTGGIPELVDEADHGHVLFHYSTESLRDALRNAIEQGGWIAKPAVPQEAARRSWGEMHAHWRSLLTPRETSGAPFSTVAAIIDHGAGARIDLTLQSLQACPSIRRVIVLNRVGETLPVKNIDLLNDDSEALERELASVVEDDVLLIHSGVAVVPGAFAAMLQALQSAPVDGLQPAGRVSGDHGWRVIPPLGGSPTFSLFEGVTFTGALLMRRESLTAARAGRPFAVESAFMGLADFCVTRNQRIWPYPEPVIERAKECLVEVKSSLPARVAAYRDAGASDRYYMLAAGYGAANESRTVTYKRELALAAIKLGLTPLVRIGAWMLRRLRRWTR